MVAASVFTMKVTNYTKLHLNYRLVPQQNKATNKTLRKRNDMPTTSAHCLKR
jgi:hypothetical protein